MLKVIDKPSVLMCRAMENLQKGILEPVARSLKNGSVEVNITESYGGVTALDKTVRTAYKEFKTRFLYDNGYLKRWKITEKTPQGELRHKVMDIPEHSSGEICLPDGTLYTFSGMITNPINMRKYGNGSKLSQEEFQYAVDFIRKIGAKKAYAEK